MRFLVNENVSPIVAQALRELGHDVSMASEHPETPDTEVLATARATDRILLTCDKGFGALVHRDRTPHAGVVIPRLRADTPERQRTVLLGAIQDGRVHPNCFLTLTDVDHHGQVPAP